ncbi:DUF2569 family protein [Kribbella pittospori]|uniref:DUF2569 family protein n=1 Tax=Kribbella pittospori TaxID=722689 RepID=A0A4R0JIC2_9ACTN|nr:DUF2569 family protein [Kribbella pittospori]TCC44398.1 DUF2569 family protein [Kribbella pittospori]
MPFVLMAIMSGGVSMWLFGFPFRRASMSHWSQAVSGRRVADQRGIRGRRAPTDHLPTLMPELAEVRGWLFCYVIALGVQTLHSFGLAVAAIIIKARPALAGLNAFVPLPSLVVYEVCNLILVVYTVVIFALMAQRKKSAIAHNVICNALAIVFLVCWHLLGMKSTLGTTLDSLPSIVGLCYIVASRRVRNTFVLA